MFVLMQPRCWFQKPSYHERSHITPCPNISVDGGKGWCGLLLDKMTYRSAGVGPSLWWLSRAPFILIIPTTPIQVITAAY